MLPSFQPFNVEMVVSEREADARSSAILLSSNDHHARMFLYAIPYTPLETRGYVVEKDEQQLNSENAWNS